MNKVKIKKGDKVKVISGKNRGKTGDVIGVIPSENKVIVSGVNVVKRHTKPNRLNDGGVIQKELPIHVSNVAFIDPKSGGVTKIGYKFLADGVKVRFAKKSGEVILKEGK